MMKALLIVVASLVLSMHQLLAQHHIAITAGLGIPELLNAGVRYGKGQNQFSFAVGKILSKEEPASALSADYYRHFAGTSKLSERRPWFMKLGLNLLRGETDFLIEKYAYLNLSVGREFNLTRNFGVQLHGGTIFQLYEHVIEKQPSYGFDLDISFPVLPSLGFAAYYKLGIGNN